MWLGYSGWDRKGGLGMSVESPEVLAIEGVIAIAYLAKWLLCLVK